MTMLLTFERRKRIKKSFTHPLLLRVRTVVVVVGVFAKCVDFSSDRVDMEFFASKYGAQ